jgi:hypothetical protein
MTQLSPPQRRQRTRHLALLRTADNALREILHAHLIDPNLRAHADRALAHVREATIAITQPTSVRTVESLTTELDRMGRLLERLSPTSSQRP